MARPGKPWWWESKGCWAANIRGERLRAPKEITKSDRLEAELWYDEQKEAVLPKAGIKAGQLLVAYLNWKFPEKSPTRNSKKSLIKTLCATRIKHKPIGDMRASDIDETHVEAVIRTWTSAGKSLGYQRTIISQWKSAWQWAARRIAEREPIQILHTNKIASAKRPPPPMVEDRFAERSEAAAWLRWLWRNKRSDYALLQRCLILTGARPGEWTGARWREIQWDAQPMPILIRQDWKAGKVVGKPRRVFIPPALARALKRHAGQPDELIFVTPRDRVRWSSTNLATTTQRFRIEAIKDSLPLKNIGADRLTCYRWRHTAASTLLMKGVDVATVAELLGTSVKMVQRHYGHLLASHLADAAQKLARSR